MLDGWLATPLDGRCEACGVYVRAGRGWLVPRPAALRGRGKLALLCEVDALASAPDDHVGPRIAERRRRPVERGGVAYSPSAYQEEGARFLARRWRALLTDDKGLGKTAQALLAVPPGAPVIVVCPGQVKEVWRSEVELWLPGYSSLVLRGRAGWTPPPRRTIHVLNYEILPPIPLRCSCGHLDADHRGRGCRGSVAVEGAEPRACPCSRYTARVDGAAIRTALGLHPETVLIADEAHRAKGSASVRTRRLRALVAACARAWGLTASPIQNRSDELWTIYKVLGLEKAAWGTRANFARLWDEGYDGQPSAPAAAEIRSRRAAVELGRGAEDVGLELPELRFEERVVALDESARALVEAALRRAIAADRVAREIREGRLDPARAEERREEIYGAAYADSDVLDLVERVVNERDWAAISAELATLRRALALAKIPAAMAYATECEEAGEPLVVFSAHVAPVEALGAREGWASLRRVQTRTEVVAAFQRGELRGVAGTIRASGEGITLHRAARALLVDRDWTPEANDQAAKRIHRIGQTRACTITSLVADHPIDRHLAAVLRRKSRLIQAVTARIVR